MFNMLLKLKSFFRARKILTKIVVPQEFEQSVRRAIVLLKDSNFLNSDHEFLNLLIKDGIDHNLAVEIVIFLPIAFVRQLFPTAKWLDTYREYIDAQNSIKRKYASTQSYQIVENVTACYFANNLERDVVLNIAGRSAEFHVINQLLLQNPNAKIEEITLIETVIIR